MEIKAVLRDALGIFGMTFCAGFVIGTQRLDPGLSELLISAASFAVILFGFCACGVRAKDNRIPHLFAVAIGLWLLSTINIPLGISTVMQWLLLVLPLILILGSIGGGISYLIARTPKQASQQIGEVSTR